MATAIEIFDAVGTQIGTATAPTLDPGRVTFVGVNSEGASYCKFEFEGLNDDVIISGCLTRGV